jgi:hypothetical protein
MDYFINAFLITFGILSALVLFRILPILIVTVVRLLTTKKWQARKYRKLMEQGNVSAAYWGKMHGFATEE